MNIILNDEKMNIEFANYLVKEFCVENIMFYNQVRLFQMNFEIMERTERDSLLRNIYELYVAPGSDFQINISSRMLKNIEDTLNKGDKSIYDEALKEVVSLMAINSLPRYEKIKNSE